MSGPYQVALLDQRTDRVRPVVSGVDLDGAVDAVRHADYYPFEVGEIRQEGRAGAVLIVYPAGGVAKTCCGDWVQLIAGSVGGDADAVERFRSAVQVDMAEWQAQAP